MDTKTLVVGQDVYINSGCYGKKGKVAKVTPLGVDVQTGVMQNDGTWNAHELLHFDDKGRSYVTELPSSYDSTAHPLSPWGWDGNGTYECGPWYIDDMPFTERTALFEKARQEYLNHPFIAWWKSATCEQRLVVVKKYYDQVYPHVRSEMIPAEDVASTADISSNFYCQALASEQFCKWWKNEATNEQRLAVVKRYYDSKSYDSVSPQAKSEWGPAEDVANTGVSGSGTLGQYLAFQLARFKS